jgi:hypothetical protein
MTALSYFPALVGIDAGRQIHNGNSSRTRCCAEVEVRQKARQLGLTESGRAWRRLQIRFAARGAASPISRKVKWLRHEPGRPHMRQTTRQQLLKARLHQLRTP